MRARRASGQQQYGSLDLPPVRTSLRAPARIHQLEAGPALVLAGAVLARRRIGLALAGLAQEARLDGEVALGRGLAALLLDEDAADRRFARGRRLVDAGPRLGTVAVDGGDAQQMRHAALV